MSTWKDWKHDKCGHGYDRHRLIGIGADGKLEVKCLKRGEEANDTMKVFLALTERYEGFVAAAENGRVQEIKDLQGTNDQLKLDHAAALRAKQKDHEADKAAAIKGVEEQNASLLAQVLEAEEKAAGLETAVVSLQKELDENQVAIIGQAKTIGGLQRRIEELAGTDGSSEVTSIPLPSAPKAAAPTSVGVAAKPAIAIVPDAAMTTDDEGGPAAAEADDAAAPTEEDSSEVTLCDGDCGKPAVKHHVLVIKGVDYDSHCCNETPCYKVIHRKAKANGLDVKQPDYEDDFTLYKMFNKPKAAAAGGGAP